MYSLLTSLGGALNMITNDDEDDDEYDLQDEPTPFTNDVRAQYSAELLDLITDCVVLQPEDRPTFDELNTRILAAVEPTERNLARGLREQPDPQHHSFVANALRLRDEQYKLLSVFRDTAAEEPVPRSGNAQDGEPEGYGGRTGDVILLSSSDDSFDSTPTGATKAASEAYTTTPEGT